MAMSLSTVVPRTGEFIALANQKDNIQMNDDNIMRNIMSSSRGCEGSFIEIQGGKYHFFWGGE